MSNYSPEHPLSPSPHEGVYDAAAFFDRAIVEAEARQLIEERDELPAIEVLRQEREDNARTALMEALTASGHLSVVEIHGTLEHINAQVLRRLLNGWDESLPPHEQQRRYAEICNELVIQRTLTAIAEVTMSPDTEILEISDYPEPLSGSSIGYRHSNKKGMVRSTSLRSDGEGRYTRVIEQASRSNGTWGSTFDFLSNCNVVVADKPADIAALETPVIYRRYQYVDGVVDIMRLLDQHAGKGTLYGDRGKRTHKHPPYEELRRESARREEDIHFSVEGLATLEQQLDEAVARGECSVEERSAIFQEEVQRILDAICILQPSYAEDTYGRRSVALFEELAVLESLGRHREVVEILQANNYLKETITFCGVSISIEEAQEKGLTVNSLGQLIEKGKENWKWKQGVCVVKSCASRPGKTEVGPCSVCRTCQAAFDKKRDPTKLKLVDKPQSIKSTGHIALARAV